MQNMLCQHEKYLGLLNMRAESATEIPSIKSYVHLTCVSSENPLQTFELHSVYPSRFICIEKPKLRIIAETFFQYMKHEFLEI